LTLELNRIYNMDCLEGMKGIPENNIDAIVTDPPYALTTTKRWKDTDQFAQNQSDVGKRFSKGFMGKEWDGKLPGIEIWAEALRVSKPGAHMLAFGGTRTHHRLMVAIEDAGWEIRDCLMWVYGSGFPKSLDVSKAIDKAAGVESKVVGVLPSSRNKPSDMGFMMAQKLDTRPNTDSAKQWNGWGTALKPAWEPIILCRKPLEGTVAQNMQKWGTGGINIDRCRVAYQSKADYENLINNYKGGLERATPETQESWNLHEGGWKLGKGITLPEETKGRFPANLIHDGSDEVLEGFPQNAGAFAPVKSGMNGKSKGIYGDFAQKGDDGASFRGDSGSASRFFYCAKASKSERNLGLPEGTTNKHPTVKPLSLIEYLIKLISVEGGTVLDPFMGSGTTGIASIRLGRKFVGYELDKDSFITAETRLRKAQEQGKISGWFA